MPRRGRRNYSGGGGGLLSSLFGGMGSFEENPDFGKQPGDVDYSFKGDPSKKVSNRYVDKRGFMNKLAGASNTAGLLDAERLATRDSEELGLASDKSRIEFTQTLLDRIEQEKRKREDELITLAHDAAVRQNPMLSGVDTPLALSPSMRGGVIRQTYGTGAEQSGLLPAMSGSTTKLAQDYAEKEAARLKADTLGATRENTIRAAQLASEGGVQQAQYQNQLLSDKDYYPTMRASGLAEMEKKGMVNVGPLDTAFMPTGRRLIGVTPEEKVVQSTMKDPKTGMVLPIGDATTTKNYKPAQELPAISVQDAKKAVTLMTGKQVMLSDDEIIRRLQLLLQQPSNGLLR